MQRALIASTAVLTLLLGYLAWSRLFHAPPPAPAAKDPAAEHGAAPGHGQAEGAQGTAPSPADHAPTAAGEAHGEAHGGKPEAASADRPAAERAKAPPRLPVLRSPDPAIATTPYLAAEPLPAPEPEPSRPRAAAGHGAPDAPARPRRPAAPREPSAARTDASPGPDVAAAPEPPLPGALAGTVRDAAGGPVAGIPVLAVSSDGDDAVEATTDEAGHYRLAGLPPGRYLLFADLMGKLAGHVPARAVEVVRGGEGRLDLREPPEGSAVRIRLLQADGATATAQVVLVDGLVPDPAALAGLLGTRAVHLPEPATPTLLRRVAAGVYTVVLFQGAATPPLVVARPLTVRGQGEQELVVRIPDDLKAPASPAAPAHGATPAKAPAPPPVGPATGAASSTPPRPRRSAPAPGARPRAASRGARRSAAPPR